MLENEIAEDKERVLDISIDMAQRNDVKTQCPRLLSTVGTQAGLFTGQELGCEGCRYHINAPEYLNCAIIAGCHGPLRRNEVADIMGITEKEVRVLEENAMNLFKTMVLSDEGKPLKHEVEKQARLAELRKSNMAVDIDILQAIVERYEKEHKRDPDGR